MRALAGVLVAACVAASGALAAGCAAGRLFPLAAAWCLVIGLVAGFAACWLTPRTSFTPSRPGPWEWAILVVFALVSLRAFLWVVYAAGDDIRILSPNNLGDLPKHWAYTQMLANGERFWPTNPLLAGTGIHYPFGVDLFSALLVACGVDVIRVFVWTGLAGAALTGTALFLWGRGFAVAAFLFNGGLFGLGLFWTGELKDFQAAAAWKSLFLSMLVTQRSLLYALPAGLLLLASWRRRCEDGAGRPLPSPLEILLYGTMPLFHLHTFLFLSGMLGWWLLFGSRDIRRHVLRVLLLALAPAAMLTWLVTDGFHGAAAIRWAPGWLQGESKMPAVIFWIANFGAFLPLAAAVCIRITWPRREAVETGEARVARLFVWPAAVLFVACAFVAFAPWEWDNTKLLIWSYLALMPFIWSVLLQPCRLWLRALACVALFVSGAISLVGGLDVPDNGLDLAKRSEIDELREDLETIPQEARIAAAPDYNHPLLFLGRRVAMAYTGFLLGHGLPWAEPERRLGKLMRGEPGWEAEAAALEADYLLWGRREMERYGDGPHLWREPRRHVVSGGWGALYDLRDRPR